MGMKLFGNSFGDSYVDNPTDPNPCVFNVEKTEQVGVMLIALVNYPNCTNYEGNKILVFKDMTPDKLKSLSKIDPHFTDSGVSPILRVVPSNEGWEIARKCAQTLDLYFQQTLYADLFLCTNDKELNIFFETIGVSNTEDKIALLKKAMNHKGSSATGISDNAEYSILVSVFLEGLYH